ncbi:MAG: sulfatase-like hydrolase/transferase [Saprospiraceae bacterium]|nr:sulfatase-like hydrolase/transferase [Saprospiraceae bacterium]
MKWFWQNTLGRIKRIIAICITTFILSVPLITCSIAEQERPNILWITSEDNGPFLGCYEDSLATTPNLDALATIGFRYTHAYANAPVCSPARNTIITGVYANSSGNQHMRSYYDKSPKVRFYPAYLREAGYYCTNNSKNDFNINPAQTKNVWDDFGQEAHYKNRPEGMPFFSIFNLSLSHESSIHKYVAEDKLRHRPENMVLPPYHPNTPEIRHDWAQYYDKIEDMDAQVGQLLEELEDSGLAENTIIMYFSDHGGVLARSKRYVYETGTRVPLIVHIPEKYKHLYPAENPGSTIKRIVSFVDLAPTLLSLLNLYIPDYMQGKAFLGNQKTDPPQYAYMFRGRMGARSDMSRAVRDNKFRYIRNYMPHRIYGQYLEYMWRAPSIRSWETACEQGKCDDIQNAFWNIKPVEELYDTENDPWEVNNLVENPTYAEVLQRMRKANHNWMMKIKDTGFVPETALAKMTKDTNAYDYILNGKLDLETIKETADFATTASPNDVHKLTALLESKNPYVRYWAATGLLILGAQAKQALEALKVAAKDEMVDVNLVAAESLYLLGAEEEGREALLKALKHPDEMARTQAMNIIDEVNDNDARLRTEVERIWKNTARSPQKRYDLTSAKYLLEKWNTTLGIESHIKSVFESK